MASLTAAVSGRTGDDAGDDEPCEFRRDPNPALRFKTFRSINENGSEENTTIDPRATAATRWFNETESTHRLIGRTKKQRSNAPFPKSLIFYFCHSK